MNLLEAAALFVIVLSVISGFRRGFVRKMAAVIPLAGSVVLISLLLPHITQFLKEQTPVYSYIEQRCQTAAGPWLKQDAAAAILNILVFFLALLLANIVTGLVMHILDKLTRIPGIRLVNRLAGAALGLLQGLFLLCLFFLLLSVFGAARQGQAILRMLRESDVLSFLYDTNLFLHIALRAAGLLA